MIHFPDTTLHRYTYTTSGVGVYGETVHDYTYSNDITVDFQNETNTEIARQYGVELQNLYKIYADIDTVLGDTDELRDDSGNTYHIIGNIQRYPKFHKYIRVHLVRNRNNEGED